jgi:hypothetical protein
VEPGNRGQGTGRPRLGSDYEGPCMTRPLKVRSLLAGQTLLQPAATCRSDQGR